MARVACNFAPPQARVDRHGLHVKIEAVLGCTSRTWRGNLEQLGHVHLCRTVGCAQAHPMHVDQYAAIDHTQIVHLAEHGKATCTRVVWIGLRKIGSLVFWIFGGFFWSFLTWACRRPVEPRFLTDDTGRRELAYESEIENDLEDRPCQAARDGVQTASGGRIESAASQVAPSRNPGRPAGALQNV